YGATGASAGLGPILLGALRAALTGAVTSPLKALGMLMPGGGAAQSSSAAPSAPVVFAPGDATAPADAGAQLAPLASLLAQRPTLGLALVGHAGEGDPLGGAARPPA